MGYAHISTLKIKEFGIKERVEKVIKIHSRVFNLVNIVGNQVQTKIVICWKLPTNIICWKLQTNRKILCVRGLVREKGRC